MYLYFQNIYTERGVKLMRFLEASESPKILLNISCLRRSKWTSAGKEWRLTETETSKRFKSVGNATTLRAFFSVLLIPIPDKLSYPVPSSSVLNSAEVGYPDYTNFPASRHDFLQSSLPSFSRISVKLNFYLSCEGCISIINSWYCASLTR